MIRPGFDNSLWRGLLAVLATLLVPACAGQGPLPASADQRARQLAQDILIVDTHIDVPYRLHDEWEDISVRTRSGDFDYVRARAGGLDAPFMSIYIPSSHQQTGDARDVAELLIDMVQGIVAASPDKFALAGSVADVRDNFDRGRMSLLMGMENGAPIEGDLGNLAYFKWRGIRYITLTHAESNHIADSSYSEDRPWQGLSPFGRELVVAMNSCGVLVDISHVSDDAFYQALAVSRVPVIASHSSPRHFTPGFERNMSDEMIVALANQGGVIQINFGSGFLIDEAVQWRNRFTPLRDAYREASGVEKYGPEDQAFEKQYRRENPFPYASLDDVLNAIDHVVRLVGIDHVGLGSDYDGVGDSLPDGLKDVAAFPNLIAGLLGRGYSEAEIEKIASGNLLRVWTLAESHADDRSCAALAAHN